MTLVRWNPWESVSGLQTCINRLLEDTAIPRCDDGQEGAGIDWRPLADAYADGSDIIIAVELPGVAKGDMTIEVKKSTLTVRGQRCAERIAPGCYYRREMCCGAFRRTFSLPAAVNPATIEASFKNGILFIRVPLTDTAAIRKARVPIT